MGIDTLFPHLRVREGVSLPASEDRAIREGRVLSGGRRIGGWWGREGLQDAGRRVARVA